VEGFGDAVVGDFELLGVVGRNRAVSLRGLEEVEDRECEALFRLDGRLGGVKHEVGGKEGE